MKRFLQIVVLSTLMVTANVTTTLPTPTQTVAATANITGVVYDDRDGDGGRDPDEEGLPGSQVKAFSPSGKLVGETNVGGDGVYELPLNSGSEPLDVRIEFTTPDGYSETPHPVGKNGRDDTRIQFLSATEIGDSNTRVNYGVGQPTSGGTDVNGPVNLVALPVASRTNGATNPDMIGIRLQADGTFFPPEPPIAHGDPEEDFGGRIDIIGDDDAGSLFGTAALSDDYVFSAAWLKRYAALGKGGLGAIYISDIRELKNSGTLTPNSAIWTQIPDVGESPRNGPNTPENKWVDGDYDFGADAAAIAQVYKVGLGDMDMGEGGRNLYVVNLTNKSLYKVPISQDESGPVAGTPQRVNMPLNLPGASAQCDQNNLYPFGLDSDLQGTIYAGLTCTGPNASDLQGYVYTYAEGGGWSSAPILEIDLTTSRPNVRNDSIGGAAYADSNYEDTTIAHWRPWQDSVNLQEDLYGGAGGELWLKHPQPNITDLTLEENGNLTINVADRFADQYAWAGTLGDGTGYTRPVGAGDMMKACPDSTGKLILEANGICGGVEGSGSYAGEQINDIYGFGDGPAATNGYRGEFYADGTTGKGNGQIRTTHDEGAAASSQNLPGFNSILMGMMHDNVSRVSAVYGHNLDDYKYLSTTGRDSRDGFYKGNGMGELSLVQSFEPIPAEVQIGDRVWLDIDKDGIQDAGEPPISNVRVALLDASGRAVDSKITNADGIYRFDHIRSGAKYQIRLDNSADYEASGALGGLELSAADQPSSEGSFQDDVDSDAAIEDVAGRGSYPTIQVTAGEASDQSLDFGFHLTNSITMSKEVVGDAAATGSGTFLVPYRVTVDAQEGDDIYTLNDTFKFNENVTVVSKTQNPAVKVTGPAGVTINTGFNGASDTTIVADQAIAAGTIHVYDIVVEVAVNLAATTTDMTCATTGDGLGTFNTAHLESPSGKVDDSACAPIPYVQITKRIDGPPVHAPDGSYQIGYTIDVINHATSDTTYDLDDQLLYGQGVTIVAATAKRTTPDEVSYSVWDGIKNLNLVTNEPIVGGATHTYAVTADFTLASEDAAFVFDCDKADGETGTGSLNRATLAFNGAEAYAEACGELPIISHKKTITAGPTFNEDGTYSISYQVDVANNGSAEGTYNLDDKLSYGSGLVGIVASAVGPDDKAITSWNGLGQNSLAEGVSIVAGKTDSYKIDVTFKQDGTAASTDLDCAIDGDEAGSGTLNTATLTVDGGSIDKTACAPFFDLALRKKLVEPSDGIVANGTKVTFGIEVFNQGSVGATEVSVVDYVPNHFEFVAADNPEWTLADGVATTTLKDPLAPDKSATIEIVLTLIDAGVESIDNFAEIAAAKDPSGNLATDIDSTADTNPSNDGVVVDDDISNTDGDEDDHDVAVVKPLRFDLALRKTVTAGQNTRVVAGQEITFDISVFNQGDLDATGVSIIDYIPEGLELQDTDWKLNDDGTASYAITDKIAAGDAARIVPITFKVVSGGEILNFTEIASAQPVDFGGKPVPITDIDSIPDKDKANDGTIGDATNPVINDEIGQDGTTDGGDEDDHDYEPIQVEFFDLALYKILTASDNAIKAGESVRFVVGVENQGTIDATNIEITDYIPAGLTFDPSSKNSDFRLDGNLAKARINRLNAGDKKNLYIYFVVSEKFDSVINFAEISKGFGPSGEELVDVDSIPDATNANSPGENNPKITGEPGGMIDDEMEGNGRRGGDEDDHDYAALQQDELSINKDVVDVVRVDSSNRLWYHVTYTINVTNLGLNSTKYILRDQPNFGDRIGIRDPSATGPDGSPIAGWDGVENIDLANGKEIKPGDTHTYSVAVVATVPATATTEEVSCAGVSATNGSGSFNQATVWSKGLKWTDDACEPFDLGIAFAKRLVGDGATLNNDGTYTVQYELAVLNGQENSDYNLSDTLNFGAGIEIVSSSVANQPGTETVVLPGWNGTTETTVIENQSIPERAIHKYLVTAVVKVADASVAVLDCKADTSGTLNTAVLTSTKTTTDSACAPIPYVEVDKQVDGPVVRNDDGSYHIDYVINVINSGPIATTYGLDDSLQFGEGVAVTNAAATRSAPEANYPNWNGIDNKTLVTDEAIDIGATHTYKVGVDFTVATTATSSALDCQQTKGETGTGTLNAATLTFNGTSTVTDCEPVSGISHSKRIDAGPTRNPDGTVSITYAVDVVNSGPVADVFDLKDELAYGKGLIAIVGAATGPDGTPIETWNGVDATDLAVGASISGGETLTYKINVTFKTDATSGNNDLNCELEEGETGTGTFNAATLIVDGIPADKTACAPLFDLALWKTTDAGFVAPGDKVDFRIVVFNQGAVTATAVEVTDYVPAGMTFDPADNPGWNIDETTGLVTHTITNKDIEPGQGVEGKLTLGIVRSSAVDAYRNVAEISEAKGPEGVDVVDIDSNPDQDSTNDGEAVDDETHNANGDEDDHDPEVVKIFDLALRKTLSQDQPDAVKIGDEVHYTINVENQGTVDATAITVTDYIPTEMSFVVDKNTDFSLGENGAVTATIDPLKAGAEKSLALVLRVDEKPGRIINFAEISVAKGPSGEDVTDVDSTPDTINKNGEGENSEDITGAAGHMVDDATDQDGKGGQDEDDHDFAVVITPDLSITKSIEPLTEVEGAVREYTATYVVTVKNSGTVATTYQLDDKPNFGEGITITSAVATGPDGTAIEGWRGGDKPTLAKAGTGIPAGQSHEYKITIGLKVAEATTSAELACADASATNGSGTFNQATVIYNTETASADACLPIEGDISFTKNLVGDGAVPNNDGTYTVTYELAVTNGAGDDQYNLTDKFNFSNGVEIVEPPTVKSDDATTLAEWNGITNTTVIENKKIAAGETHKYTVTAVVKVTDISIAYLDCAPAEGAGAGTLNNAQLVASKTLNGEACAPLPYVGMEKQVKTGPIHTGNGVYQIGYQIDVRNQGPIATTYDLADNLKFGEGVKIAKATAVRTAPTEANYPDWNGDAEPKLVTGEAIDAGATHTYTVTVDFTIRAAATATALDCKRDNGETGTGTLNEAILTFNGDITDEACGESPLIVHTKDVVSGPSKNEDGSMSIAYEVKVSNLGSAEGTYDLADKLNYAKGIVDIVAIASLDGNPIAEWNGVDNNILASAAAIGAGKTHTYTINVTFGVDGSSGHSDSDCSLAATESGTGTLNTATLSVDGAVSDRAACAPLFDLALWKVTKADIVAPGDEVKFEIYLVNQGGVTAKNVTITDYVPAGLSFDPAKNSSWDYNSDTQMLTHKINYANILPGHGMLGAITFDVIGSDAVDAYKNLAEISSAGRIDDVEAIDVDSTPNNDPNDDGPVTDNEINNANNDEDDHDPAAVRVFDLALTKKLVEGQADVVRVGETVGYAVRVENQGGVDASAVRVTDYVPAGMSFVNDAELNPDFVEGDDGVVSAVVDSLPVDGVVDLTLVLRVDRNAKEFINFAEISEVAGPGGVVATDIDSVPDALNGNGSGENNEAVTGVFGNMKDDVTNENGLYGGDEDDHDFAKVGAPVFDLALMKKLQSPVDGVVFAGDSVTFEVSVVNQGGQDATDIKVVDYVPNGLALAESESNDFVLAGGVPTATIPLLAAGATSEPLTITFTYDGSVDGSVFNRAEISSAVDESGRVAIDVDSTPDGEDGTGSGENNTVVTGIDGNMKDDVVDQDVKANPTTDDEDDHDFAEVLGGRFDLALRKKLLAPTDGNVVDGTKVTFGVEVFNQGNIEATNVVVVDYVADHFKFVATDNPNWVLADGKATTTLKDSIAAGESKAVEIVLEVVDATVNPLNNFAEVNGAAGPDGVSVADFDSIPDNVNVNGDGENSSEITGVDGNMVDDEIGQDGRNGGDEDDHDVAVVEPLHFDLALRKTLAEGEDSNVNVGEDVTFNISVFNQGEIDAKSVSIVDYVPAGLELNDTDWTFTEADRTASYLVGDVARGADPVLVPITFTVVDAGELFNFAEIAKATPVDHAGATIPIRDFDSTPNSDIADDGKIEGDDANPVINDVIDQNGKITGQDEDDHDYEQLTSKVFDLALRKVLVGGHGVRVGESVDYVISVVNQGGVDATNVVVSDYVPVGMTFVSGGSADGGVVFGVDGDGGVVSATVPSLLQGESVDLGLTLRLDVAGRVTNFAEVSGAFGPGGVEVIDVDSVPDAVNNNGDGENSVEVTGVAGDMKDDVVDEDGRRGGDEDDHDYVVVVTPELKVSKVLDAGSPVDKGDGVYEVSYTVMVENVGVVDSVYQLDDKPSYGDGVTIGSASAVGPDGVLVDGWDGVDVTLLAAAGTPIAVGDTDVYKVVVNASVASTTTTQELGCAGASPEDGSGSFNQAVLVFDGQTKTADACGEFKSGIEFTKKVGADGAIPNGDGTFTVVYELSVVNGAGEDQYDLLDKLDFGDGLQIVDAPTVANDLGLVTNPAWDGVADTVVINDQPIAAGVTHTYTVTVKVKVTDIKTANPDCAEDQGKGTLNTATMNASETGEGEACVPLPHIEIDKQVDGGVVRNADGTYRIEYLIDVVNSGEVATTYNLDDTLKFGQGIEIIDGAAARKVPTEIDYPNWNGIDNPTLVKDEAIAANITHTYKVMVNFRVPSTLTSAELDCEKTATEEGTGTLNAATLSFNGEATADEACGELPDIVHYKRASAATRNADGNMSVEYEIDVVNRGANAGTYYLDDKLAYGDGLTVIAAKATGPTGKEIKGWNGTNKVSLAKAASIAVNETVTYKIEVTFKLDGSSYPTDLDCATDGGEEGTGTLNAATLNVSGDTSAVVACTPLFDLALRKVTTSSEAVEPGTSMPFDIEVLNQGGQTATDIVVTDYIPVGLKFDAVANPNWAYDNATGKATTTIAGPLAPGDSTTVTIHLGVVSSNVDGSYTNAAEIDDAKDPDGKTPDDVDSTPDGNPSNDGPDTDDEIDNKNGDEDDHDPATANVFDLALRKRLMAPADGEVEVGSKVTFNIEVFNQGTIDATNVELVDYIADYFELDAADNPDWTPVNGGAVTTLADPLAPGDSISKQIVLTVTDTAATPLGNFAEIDAATGPNGQSVTDIDSQADRNPTNDGPVTDNAIDNEDGDEDDHDGAIVEPLPFDLALRKTLGQGERSEVFIGSNITFDITVFNQGSLDAADITIVDYIPAGLELNDPDWELNDNGTAEINIGTLAVHDDPIVIPITFKVVAVGDISNFAEISTVTPVNHKGDPLPVNDIDSIPDVDPTNDGQVTDNAIDNENEDEDDNDIESLHSTRFDLALRKNSLALSEIYVGNEVEFKIDVFNQGDVDAYNVDIVDYLPTGFDYSASTGWKIDPDSGRPVTTIAGPIKPKTSQSVKITAIVTVDALGDSVNFTEITDAETEDGRHPTDADSTPDDDPTNDGSVTDNAIDNEDGDEDDHDKADVAVKHFDLALRKTTPSKGRSYSTGDEVEFAIEIINQGDIAASNIHVVDEIPEGLQFLRGDSEPGWSRPADGKTTIVVPGPLKPGESVSVKAIFRVDATSGKLVNFAEITDAETASGDRPSDIDSTPDNDLHNDPTIDDEIDGTPETGDEDDEDPEAITVETIPPTPTPPTTPPVPTPTTTSPVPTPTSPPTPTVPTTLPVTPPTTSLNVPTTVRPVSPVTPPVPGPILPTPVPNPHSDMPLPATGSNPGVVVSLAGLLLLSGLGVFGLTHRRRRLTK